MKEEAKAVLEGGKGAGKKSSKKSSKKRKGGDAVTASAKKSKKADGSAGDEGGDTKVRAGDAIFIQPPNLAPGCVLKDYQLEGIRWLASLWTNGVSGILADEMGL